MVRCPASRHPKPPQMPQIDRKEGAGGGRKVGERTPTIPWASCFSQGGSHGYLCRCEGGGSIKCPSCDGKGQKFSIVNALDLTRMDNYDDCTKCDGTGEVKCPVCHGSGEVDD